MISFFADNHYGQHPGRVLFEHLPEELRKKIRFCEDDWRLLESGIWEPDCSLLSLNLSMQKHLQSQITQLLAEMIAILILNGIKNFVALLK